MICTMEVIDPTGHAVLEWDPDDAASVAKAEAEFEAMRAAGFAFFTTLDAQEVDEIGPGAGMLVGKLEPALEQVREFKPRKQRQVAVRPMRGG